MIFFWIWISVAPAFADGSISLEEAYFSALSRTETVPIGQARLEAADARVSQARGRFFPMLSFGANFQQQDTSGILARQSSSLFGGGQSYTRLSLSQSIFEGGRDRAALSAAQAEQGAQGDNLSAARSTVYANVARGYYAVLSAQREVMNLKRTIELARERVNEIERRTKIGRSRNIELLAAQAQLSVLESQLMAAEGQNTTARDQFILNTGIGAELQLRDDESKPRVPGPVEAYLKELDRRPDLGALRSTVEGARSTVSAARAGHYPSLALGGNYYLTREGTQKGNNWDVSASLTLPLFAGGIVRGQVREAESRATEAELALGLARRQAEIAVRAAYDSLTSYVRQLGSLEKALKITEQNYKEQEKNYRFGQATNLDVIQALNTFQDTRRTLDRTRYLALSGWTDLKSATADVPAEDGAPKK